MFKGIFFALVACFIWGLIFIVPHYMKGFDSFEIALGRYLVYGLSSCVIYLITIKRQNKRFSSYIWLKAFIFALLANILYYSCVVLGVRFSTPSITALILGLSPITISLYGNWQQKECDYTKLIVPSLLIGVGLILVNLPVFQGQEWEASYFGGMLASFMALASWSWYVVANTAFLKRHPEVSSSAWSTLMGVATFICAIILSIVYEFFIQREAFTRFYVPSAELQTFIAGCLILGIVCSWVGAYLWNTASFYLPVSLAGQMMIFETIFGLIFFYVLEHTLPPAAELMGVALMLFAILYGIQSFLPNKISVHQENSIAP